MQANVSIVPNLEVVRYSGAAIALHTMYIMETSVDTCSIISNLVEVRYSECPLIESPL